MTLISEADAGRGIGDLKIPPQPEILFAVQNELKQESPDIRFIARKIEQDGGLFSGLLKLINSPYFGLRSKIESIPHAISLIGLDSLSTNIACIKLKTEFDNAGFSYLPRYWDSAFSIAKLSSHLANELRVASAHEAYVLGLFKDSGIPILTEKYPNYINIIKLQNENEQENYTDIEDQTIDTNHCVVGYLLMMRWGMSLALRHACLYHHDVAYIRDQSFQGDQKTRILIMIMKIASYVVQSRRGERDIEWPKIKECVLYYLSLSEHDFDDLCLQLHEFSDEQGI